MTAETEAQHEEEAEVQKIREERLGRTFLRNRLERLVDQAIDNGLVLASIAFSLFIVLAALAFGVVNANNAARDSEQRAEQLVTRLVDVREGIAQDVRLNRIRNEEVHHELCLALAEAVVVQRIAIDCPPPLQHSPDPNNPPAEVERNED